MSVMHLPGGLIAQTLKPASAVLEMCKRAESKMHMHVLHNAGTATVSKTKLLRDLSTTSSILQDEGKTAEEPKVG